MKKAEVEVFHEDEPHDEPEFYIGKMDLTCPQCSHKYIVYFHEDGDLFFECPCGMSMCLSGPLFKVFN
jgi:hypothetical protein